MKVSILWKLLLVIMVLTLVPLIVLGVMSMNNISNVESTAITEVNDMSAAVSADVSDATTTAVADSTEALNALGAEFVYQKAGDIAWQMRLYLEANPDLTQADLQGETYLIYESAEAQQEGAAPLYAGVHYGADNSAELSLVGEWIVTYGGEWNRFVDEGGSTVDLAGKWIMNASDGSAGVITSNTASTVSATLASLGNPFAECDWDSGDSGFWSIAIQNINRETSAEVENIGYSVLCDAATGIPMAHPNPLVVGLPDHVGRAMYPKIYELMDQTIASGQPEMGIFPFDEDNNAETPDVDRFAVFYPVKDANGEFVTVMGPDPANPATLVERPLMISAAVIMTHFNEPAITLGTKLQNNQAAVETQLVANSEAVAASIESAKSSTQTSAAAV